MNIECQQCNTHYQISDKKVQGEDRVFKIRCKNCGAIITFNGIAATNDDTAPAAATMDDPSVWYYVKEGQQEGPMSIAELRVARAEGLIDTGTYVWRTGMDDWQPVNSVDELSSLLQEPAMLDQEESTEVPAQDASDGQEHANESSEAVSDNTDSAQADDSAIAETHAADVGYDPDATIIDQPSLDHLDMMEKAAAHEHSANSGGSGESTVIVDEQALESSSDDLFAPRCAEESPVADQDSTLDNLFVGGSSATDAGNRPEQAGSEPEDDDSMVWQRHDNSVLFSLNDSDDSGPAPARKAPQKSEPQDAFAALPQDSGLIDIRSFSKKKKEKAAASVDLFADLAGDSSESDMPAGPLLGAATATSMPVIQRKKGGNGALYAAIAFGVVALAAIGALVFMLVTKDSGPAPTDNAVAKNTASDKQSETAGAKEEAAATSQGTAQKEAQPAAAQPKAAPAAAPSTATQPTTAVQAAPTPAAAGAIQPTSADAAAGTAQPDAVPAQPTTTQPAGAQEPAKAAADGEGATANGEAAAQPAAEAKPKKPLTPAERRKLAERRERLRKQRETKRKADAEAKAAQAAKAKAAQAAAAAKKNPPKVDPNALLKKMGAPPKKPSSTAAAPSSGGAELPAKPTTSQVKKTMRSANGRIRSCVKGAGESGKVIVSFRISPGGSTSGISVSGTSASSCIKSAVAGLRFPKSKQGRSVRFPFSIK